MENPGPQTISVQEFKKLQEVNPHLCLIDVRENEEWDEMHIPGALHIPKDQLPGSIRDKIPQHDQAIYLYCRAGGRSMNSAHQLITMGYQEVYSIDGGIIEWEMFGYPIERGTHSE